MTFIIKTMDKFGIESCGFVLKNTENMEKYCDQITEHISSIRKIRVYSCSEPIVTIAGQKSGLSLYGSGMRIFREINLDYMDRPNR